jgi:hypothetical protein
MSTQAPETPVHEQPVRAGWRDWLRVAAAALALLTLSEALWLWQTWPVRELLHPVPARTQPAGAR